ncbi:MAG TPA: DinB family protein [Pirellulaceae bacterium]|nr:DinB family protein [Pirellulaceae bacterium]HMO92579.1 DinB family protein [Pirellulaceae bacterium]HMP70623.1 DinB family protein [Pirellulaceae bacterium]
MATRLNHIFGILRWTVWANDRLLDATTKAAESCAGALPIFSHIFAAEHIWLYRIDGTQPLLEVWPTFTWHECKQWMDKNRNAIATLEASLSESDLDRIVKYTSSTGIAGAMRTIDILTHVGTHGAYHRGQIAKIVGRFGGQVPLTDYFVYVRETSTGG